MSQTSTERLRDYLGQLPPQSQALLMREFERAIERGEDTTVATFVLEQLRKVVRSTDEEARPRTDDPARLLFRPLEPFLIEAGRFLDDSHPHKQPYFLAIGRSLLSSQKTVEGFTRTYFFSLLGLIPLSSIFGIGWPPTPCI